MSPQHDIKHLIYRGQLLKDNQTVDTIHLGPNDFIVVMTKQRPKEKLVSNRKSNTNVVENKWLQLSATNNKTDEKKEEKSDSNVNSGSNTRIANIKRPRNVDSMTNPFVVLLGIEDYSKAVPKQINLPGVNVDITKMSNLWSNIYHYQDIQVAFHSKNGKNKNDQGKCLDSKEQFSDWLTEIRTKIEFYKRNDGLILYYSGHGVKDNIILSNGKKFLIENILKIFSGQNCVWLRDKPKIMIYDCCRGSAVAPTYIDTNEMKSNENNARLKGNSPNPAWMATNYHEYSGFGLIFANFINFSINDSDYGSCLSRAICTVFSNPNQIRNETLQNLIVDIRRETKKLSGKGNVEYGSSNQLVEFRETLEKRVYFLIQDKIN